MTAREMIDAEVVVPVPKGLVIGPFEITFSHDPLHLPRQTDEDECLGEYSPKDLRIAYMEGLPKSQERVTVTHEVIHGLWDMLGFGEVTKLKDFEEFVVSALAPALVDFLRRNPSYVDWVSNS